MEFPCWSLRLWFEARQPVQFPATMTANLFRGALGAALPRALFAPQSHSGPSGVADPPRPFVLRARHLDGCLVNTGERFPLDVHLFSPISHHIAAAFSEAAPAYGNLVLVQVGPEEQRQFKLAPDDAETSGLTVTFLTPTELKLDSGLATQPDFPVLFARASGRLRSLAGIYHHPLTLDWTRLQHLSESICLTSHSLIHEFAERHSTHTGKTHPLGGFTGQAHYQGELRELLPILEAAAFTGVGRQTVWGKGEISLEREVPATNATPPGPPTYS